MIQSESADSSLRKSGRPLMVRRSNVAPDLASSVRTGSRLVAPAISSASESAPHALPVGADSVSTGGLHLGEQFGAPAPAAEHGVGGDRRPGDGEQVQLVR